MVINKSPAFVWKLALGALALAGSLFLSVLTSSPAHAVDCADAASVCTLNGGTSTQTGSAPASSSSGGSCGQDLPSDPTVTCGYASIQHGYSAGKGTASVSGLPGQWGVWGNMYANQCTNSSYQAYDPATGSYLTYYAKGVYWTDQHYWTPQIVTAQVKKSVTVAPGVVTYTTSQVLVSPATTKTVTVLVNGRKITTTVPVAAVYKTVTTATTAPVIPVTVTYYYYVDNTLGSADYTRETTYTKAGTYTYTETHMTINPMWNGRNVIYGGCSYPAAPDLNVVADCPTSVGPGYMTGPTGNAASTPWPVPTGPGKFDPQTEKKTWQTAPSGASSNPDWLPGANGGTLYSSMGMAWRSAATRAIFSQVGNTTALGYVKGCRDLTYQTSAKDQPCKYLGSTFPAKNGTWLAASDTLCNFTPGNYAKAATGQSTQCKWVQYNWDAASQAPSSKQTFISCTPPAECANCAVNDNAHWLCNDPTGSNGIAPSNVSFFCVNNDTYECTFANNAAPVIHDPAGVLTKNGSQILGNGKQWKITWTPPSASIKKYVNGVYVGTTPAQDMWLQWVKASNSEPFNTSVSMTSDTQPVFAHYDQNADPATTTSVLTGSGSTTGKTSWSPTDLYFRAYQGAGVNTTGGTLYVGKTEGIPNFATVAKNSLIPFGVYAAYVYTHPMKTTTGQGGAVTVNAPETCATQMATFYVTSGRPTS